MRSRSSHCRLVEVIMEEKEREEAKKEEAALLDELALLGSMMKLHEWTRFGQEDAAKEACLEANLDAEARPQEDALLPGDNEE